MMSHREGGNPITPKEMKGHMSHVRFEDEQARQELSKHLKGEHYRRSAGSFIHSFAIGLVSYDEVLDIIAQEPRMALGCIDDDLNHIDGECTITSHASCGASGVVTGLMKDNPEAAARIASVLGEEVVKKIRKTADIDPDMIGQVWSQQLIKDLKEKRGVEFTYQHVGVTRYDHNNHKIHGATGALVNINLQGEGNFVDRPAGERPFVITNHRPGEVSETSLNDLAKESALAAYIAFGGHGILSSEEGQFTVMVEQDKTPDMDLSDFEARVQGWLEKLQVSPENRARVQVVAFSATR